MVLPYPISVVILTVCPPEPPFLHEKEQVYTCCAGARFSSKVLIDLNEALELLEVFQIGHPFGLPKLLEC